MARCESVPASWGWGLSGSGRSAMRASIGCFEGAIIFAEAKCGAQSQR